MADLQGLVDALAAEVGRPAGVDDRQFRAVAYSSHEDEVDRVRLASILHRLAPAEVTGWLESLGIRDAVGVTRIPANGELAMAARVCVPLRFEGTLLGYLWLIDEPDPLSASELGEVERYAEELGAALYRARRIENEDRERELALLAQVAGLRGGDARAASAELIHDGLLAPASSYAVLVAQAVSGEHEEMPDSVRTRLAAAAEQVRRGSPPRHVLLHLAGDEVIGTLACEGQETAERRAQALAAAAEVHLADVAGWSPIVACGAQQEAVGGLGDAYREARQALQIARALGRRGVVTWDSLEVFRTLAALLDERDPRAFLGDAFERLLAASEAATLLDTLERYLDHAADARAAAADLFIHRSSLYGRLRRIEEITGLELRSGAARLELHLALRLWRLGGGTRDGGRVRAPSDATASR
jgi:sugar diacid utilization regulator